MSLRLTILCENSIEKVSPTGLLGEHGFACHLQSEEGNYLFDTGGGFTLEHNCELLKVDLQQLQGVILSHGHRDHTGGLKQVLQHHDHMPIYTHPELFLKRYSRNGKQLRSIGIPWDQQQLEAMGAVFQLDRGVQILTPSMTLSGEIPRNNRLETGDPNLVVKTAAGETTTDVLADDLSLFIISSKGLIILLGCAHAGVLNIIAHAQKVTGVEKIHMLIGGTHLKFSSDAQLEATLDKLAALDIDRIGTSHCTGLRQAQILAERFGSRFFTATVGTEILVEE